jgi:hypothetical protein
LYGEVALPNVAVFDGGVLVMTPIERLSDAPTAPYPITIALLVFPDERAFDPKAVLFVPLLIPYPA